MNWKYAISLGISLLILLILFLQVDLSKVLSIISKADPLLVAVCVAFTILNLASKVIRWKFFLNAFRIKISTIDLASTYLASLFLSNISPARVGEISRPYFLKKRKKTPFFRILPSVLVERFLDLAALLIVSMFFLLFYSMLVSDIMKVAMFLTFLAILATLIIALKKEWMKKATYSMLAAFSMKRYMRHIDKLIDNFYVGLKQMRRISLSPILIMTLTSLVCEVLILYFAAMSLGLYIDLTIAFGFLSLSLLTGTMSSLPGGLGSTEAVLFALLLLISVSPALAVSIAILSRFLSYGLSVVFSFPFFLREVK